MHLSKQTILQVCHFHSSVRRLRVSETDFPLKRFIWKRWRAIWLQYRKDTRKIFWGIEVKSHCVQYQTVRTSKVITLTLTSWLYVCVCVCLCVHVWACVYLHCFSLVISSPDFIVFMFTWKNLRIFIIKRHATGRHILTETPVCFARSKPTIF